MLRQTLAFIAVAAASGGCIRSTVFNCDNNTECGAGGMCEAASGGMFCSFVDSNCASGRAFGDNSGPLSGQCTDMITMPPEGGGMEMTGNEMTSAQCPGNYNTLPNSGTRMHRYRLINQSRSWTTHRDDCQAAGVAAGKTIFMAFPDGPEAAMELAALRTLAGDNAWVGVEDITGTVKNTLGVTASAQTQALISTSGSPGDCFLINGTVLDDSNCNDSHPTVCECVP